MAHMLVRMCWRNPLHHLASKPQVCVDDAHGVATNHKHMFHCNSFSQGCFFAVAHQSLTASPMPRVPNKLHVACMLPAAKSAENMMYGGMTVNLKGISPGKASTTTAGSLSLRCRTAQPDSEHFGHDYGLTTILAHGALSGVRTLP